MTLTHVQAQVLGTVSACGPCDVFEIDRNILCGVERARGVLVRLERRGLVARDYTSRTYRGRFGYVTTSKGDEAAEHVYTEDTDGD